MYNARRKEKKSQKKELWYLSFLMVPSAQPMHWGMTRKRRLGRKQNKKGGVLSTRSSDDGCWVVGFVGQKKKEKKKEKKAKCS